MRYVKHGNLDKLKVSIETGEATIWDTAPDGWSLLHVSLTSRLFQRALNACTTFANTFLETAAYNRQLPVVKYLMDLGCDQEAGDFAGR